MHVFAFAASFISQNNWKIRLFPKPVGKSTTTSRPEIKAFRMSIFGKRDKRSCSASAIITLSMVSIVDSLLSTFTHQPIVFLRCETNAYFIGPGCAGSLSFPSRAAALISRVSRLRVSRLRSLTRVANWRKTGSWQKKRDCSQST